MSRPLVPNPSPIHAQRPAKQGRKRATSIASTRHVSPTGIAAETHHPTVLLRLRVPHALYEEKQWLAMFGPFFGPSLWLTGRQHYTCINSALRALGPEDMLRTSREKGLCGLCGGLGLDLRLQGLDLGLITCLDGH